MNYIPYGMCRCGCGYPAPIATKTARSEGATKGDPRRYIYAHHLKQKRPAPVWSDGEQCYLLELNKGVATKVDRDDLDKVSGYNWYAHKRSGGNWYVTAWVPKGSGKSYHMHRIIMDAPEGMLVDHISGDTLDNRRSNLRIATKAQNCSNLTRLKSNNKSGHTGVHWSREQRKWIASVQHNKTRHYIGAFSSIDDAVSARSVAAREVQGEFAPTIEEMK